MRGPTRLSRAAVALPIAVLLSVATALGSAAAAPVSPAVAGLAAPAVLAADGLDIQTSARYVVLPDKALVRVSVQLEVRNDTPDKVSGGVVTYYSYFDGVNVGVQPEAANIAATQDGVRVSVSASRRSGYRLVAIHFRTQLRYRHTSVIGLTFDLPAGKPRSTSDVRVGPAFATFLAWAFGDAGTVRIEVPRSFTVDVTGEEMARTTDGDTTVLTASTTDPLGWYAWIDARNDAGLSSERLDIEGGEEIIVRGWPEDGPWRTRVADMLTRGVPELVSLIGLPWPVRGALSVIEIHSPLLEGYAGFYDPESDQITISEDLDDLTIIHEASHAWFDSRLFTERWITEGLADEYAARVLTALGGDRQSPDRVIRTDPAAFPLNSWPPPAAIQDEQSAAKETYGYDASWMVIRQVVDAVGEDGMRKVLAAAADHTTAYVGGGSPERTALPNDWRRFLDLTEELGGARGVAGLLQTWALPTGYETQLKDRAAARDAYHLLLAASRGWAAPYALRAPLDGWAFAVAGDRIDQARSILRQRDETAALASQEQLTPPPTLRPLYEHAEDADGLAAAASVAADTEAALETVAAADEAAAAPRDWLVALGLEGRDPDADLAAARAAWTSGDLEVANTRAALVVSVLAAAPDAGRERAVLIGTGIGGTLLLVLLVGLLLRRRSRRRRIAAMAGASPVAVAAWPLPPAPPAGPRHPPASSAPPAVERSYWPVAGASEPREEPREYYATLPPSAPSPPDPAPGPIDDEGAGPP